MKIVLVLMLTSFFLVAKDRKTGNGGDVINCNGNLELLDYYEGRLLKNYTYDFGLEVDEFKIANYLLEKIDRDFARYVVYKKQIKNFLKEVEFTEKPLVDIPDHGYVFRQVTCTITQAIIQIDPSEHSENKRYIIHEPTWRALSPQNKAGLILHEIIYREVINYKAKHSKGVRQANAYLASIKRPSSIVSLVKLSDFADSNSPQTPKRFFFDDNNYSWTSNSYHQIQSELKRRYPRFLPETLFRSLISQKTSGSDFRTFERILMHFYKRVAYTQLELSQILEKGGYFSLRHIFSLGNFNLREEALLRYNKEKDILIKSMLVYNFSFKDFHLIEDLIGEISKSEDQILKSVSIGNVLNHLEPLTLSSRVCEKSDRSLSFWKSFVKILKVLIHKFPLFMKSHPSYPFVDTTYKEFIYQAIQRKNCVHNNKIERILSSGIEDILYSIKPKDKVKFSNFIDLIIMQNDQIINQTSKTDIWFYGSTKEGTVSERINLFQLDFSVSFYNELIKRRGDYLVDKNYSVGLTPISRSYKYNEIYQDKTKVNTPFSGINFFWLFTSGGAKKVNFNGLKAFSMCFGDQLIQLEKSSLEVYNNQFNNQRLYSINSFRNSNFMQRYHYFLDVCDELIKDLSSIQGLQIDLNPKQFSFLLDIIKIKEFPFYSYFFIGKPLLNTPYRADVSKKFRFLSLYNKILIYNVLNQPSYKDLFLLSKIEELGSLQVDWDEATIYILSQDYNLRPSYIEAIIFSFNKSSKKQELLERVISVQKKIGPDTVKWLRSILNSDYQKEIKITVKSILGNLI